MKIVVLGGGLAGLSTALNLPTGFEISILEKETRLGGLLKTDDRKGFLFDYGPHLFFHTDPYFLEIFEKAMAQVGYVERPAKTGQFSFQKLIDFPYAIHLHGLPSDIAVRCVTDFALRQIELARQTPPVPKNYEDYCRTYFGDGFTDHFMIPYAKKIWTVHPRDLATDWVGTRIVLPDLKEVIHGALESRNVAGNYIKNFRYPMTGGTQSFVNGLESMLEPNVSVTLNSDVVEIDPKLKCVTLSSGQKHFYDCCVSSLPLPELAKRTVNLPRQVQDLVDQLKWFGVLLLNYPSQHLQNNSYQWIYFDQQDAVFHRIHYPTKLSDHMGPEGHQSLQAEISFSKARALPGSPDSLVERAWKELNQAGLAHDSKTPELAYSRPIEYAYAIMDSQREAAVKGIHEYYLSVGIVPCGRFGDWDYIWTDRVLLSGKKAAKKVGALFT